MYSHGLESACLTKVVEGAVNEGQFTSEVGLWTRQQLKGFSKSAVVDDKWTSKVS